MEFLFQMYDEEDWDNPSSTNAVYESRTYHPRNNQYNQYNKNNQNNQNFNGRNDQNKFGRGRGWTPAPLEDGNFFFFFHLKSDHVLNSFCKYPGYNKQPRFNRNDSCEMIVDSQKIGKIIGKGGCKIKELQEQSGARIQVKIADIA